MVTLILKAMRGMRTVPRLAALALCALLLLPGLLGLPAQAATASRAVATATLPNGTLIRDSVSGRIYVVWAGRRHWIDSPATLRELAYDTAAVINLNTDQVDTLPNGTVLSLHTVAGGLVWPWSPIQANPVHLQLAQPGITAGSSLRVDASGFQPGEVVTISAPNSVSFTAFAGGQGSLSVSVPILTSVTIGLHRIYAQGGQSGFFIVQIFHVIAPAPMPGISVNPNPVTHGTNLSVSASGFAPNEQVEVYLNGGMSAAVAATNATGGFGPLLFPVPGSLTAGSYDVQSYGVSSARWAAGRIAVVDTQPSAPMATTPPNAVVTVNPAVSSPGSQVTIGGTGFAAGETVLIQFNGKLVAGVTAGAAGSFAGVVFGVPSGTASGTYKITATGAGTQRTAGVMLLVQAPQAVPTPTAVPAIVHSVVIVSPAVTNPGSQVVVSGSGFAPGETVLLRFNGVLMYGTTANAAGNFAGVLLSVPSGTASGTYGISATGATSQRSSNTALIVQAPQAIPAASIAISPLIALPGTQVLIAGTGFQPGEVVLVSFNNVLMQNRTADASGSFTNGNFIVPATLRPGAYRVLVVGATSGRGASASLTVNARPAVLTARLTVNPSTVAPGGHTTIVGSGFNPGEQVLLRLDGVVVKVFIADRSGTFSLAVTVNVALGKHTLSVTGGSSGRSATASLTLFRPVTPGIGLIGNKAHRGNVVKVNGNNFLAGEVVLIRFGNTLVQAATADRNGRFINAAFTVPGSAKYGITYVSITGSRSGRSARAALTITAAPPAGAHLKLSSTKLHRGTKVKVSGGGYQGGEILLIRFRGGLVQAATADKHGNFSNAGFQVPVNSPYGNFTVVVNGARSGRSATVKVSVTATPPSVGISVSPTTVKRNSNFTVSGHGFTAGETDLIRLNGQLVQIAKVDKNGNFSRISIHIQAGTRKGKETLLVTGARSGRHAQLTITIA